VRRDAPLPALTPEEEARYARHLALPEVGAEGQKRLKAARVLCVGAGGLGSPLALYLAAAGVGTIGLADADAVDATNLQRQILYGTSDVGRRKVEAAAARLSDANPHVTVVRHDGLLTSANALEVFAGYDVVADGTDNFPARYLVNDACVLLGKPNVWASVFRFEGQASVFGAPGGPCYRCLYEEPPPPGLVPSCAEGGVLGVLPGLLGTIQATEVLKLLLGAGEPLVGRLLLVDALAMTTRTIAVARNPSCAVCGTKPTVTRLADYEAFCGTAPAPRDTSPSGLDALLSGGTPPFVLDVREPFEFAAARIPGAVNVPLGSLEEALGRLPRDRDVVVVCESGARSARATALLVARGFARAVNLAGGTSRWAREGRSVSRG
jgi:adenylyltransferase/sulfurtransferase